MYLKKLDNILFNESTIKLTDFNWAAKITNYAEPTFCGTTHYMPPEIILLQPHNEKVDCWSLGVILYVKEEILYRNWCFVNVLLKASLKKNCKNKSSTTILLLNATQYLQIWQCFYKHFLQRIQHTELVATKSN